MLSVSDFSGSTDWVLRFFKTVFEIKGQVLHPVHLHMRVPGWLPDMRS